MVKRVKSLVKARRWKPRVFTTPPVGRHQICLDLEGGKEDQNGNAGVSVMEIKPLRRKEGLQKSSPQWGK